MCPTARIATLSALFAFATLGSAEAQQRRLLGRVLDGDGKPVDKASITATSPDVTNFRFNTSTNAKGEFTVMVLALSITELRLRIEKDGFLPSEAPVELPTGGSTKMEFKLESEASRKAAEVASKAPDPADPHNAGVEAAKLGDWATAAIRFEEALAIKEDLPQTHAALATAAWNLKQYDRAEKHARRALELNPALPDVQRLLADSLEAEGKKAEAEAELQKVAAQDPKLKAQIAFNHGAELANQKGEKDQEAIAAFEEAVAADPELAEAYYALGITTFRTGDMARAKSALAKYLEIAPEGKNAETAKAVLKAAEAPPAKAKTGTKK